MASFRYRKGAELPSIELTWEDTDGEVIDFSAGWTFTVTVAPRGETTASFTKTTGITGAAGPPNVTIAWATTGELNSLAAGAYDLQLRARRAADSKDRDWPGSIRLVISEPIA